MKKLLLPLFLLITSCGDIITKIEKEVDTSQSIDLSSIQVSREKAKTNLLDCALFVYKHHPFGHYSDNGYIDYLNSSRRLAILANEYANQKRFNEAKNIFIIAEKIADDHLTQFGSDYARTLSFIAEQQIKGGLISDAKPLLKKTLEITLKSNDQLQKEAMAELAPQLVYAGLFDEAITLSNQMHEHDRFMVLAKTAIEWNKNNQHQKAKDTVDQLYDDITTIQERSVNIYPVNILRSYAHVVGVYYELGNIESCEVLIQKMINLIDSDPPTRAKDIITAASILAEDYKLADYAYTIASSCQNNFAGAKGNDLIDVTSVLFEQGKIENGSALLDGFTGEWHQFLNQLYKADCALRIPNLEIREQSIDNALEMIRNADDNSIAGMHIMLAECYAKAKEKRKMIDQYTQALVNMQKTSINHVSYYVWISRALYENGYPEPPEIQTELKKIIDEHI